MPTTPKHSPQPTVSIPLNVAQRLRQAVSTAEEMGFEVRKVVLDDQTPGWCQVGDQKILFLDLRATTSEQLQQLDEIIAAYCKKRRMDPDAAMEGRLAA